MNFGDKTGFNVRAMFAKSYFAFPVLQDILHHYFVCKLYHFVCLPILYGDIVRIKNYHYDRYFSIAAWRKECGKCDAKVKEKHQKKIKESNIY